MKVCFVLLLLGLLAVAKAACPAGTLTSYSDSSVCYGFHAAKLPYLDAENVCKSYGGHLITLNNAFDNTFVADNAHQFFNDSNIKNFWIGANDIFLHGKWTWLDGTPFSYSDWDSKQPKNDSKHDCASMKISSGKWETDNCNEKKKAYICGFKGTGGSLSTVPIRTTTTTVPMPVTTVNTGICAAGWTYWNVTNACYNVFNEAVSWQQAEANCVNYYGHLVSIHSKDEDIFITNLKAPPYYHWLGFYKNDTGGVFYWSDGTPFDYQDWIQDAPDSTPQWNCGVSTYEPDPTDANYGTWSNYLCDADPDDGLNSYICKHQVS